MEAGKGMVMKTGMLGLHPPDQSAPHVAYSPQVSAVEGGDYIGSTLG